MTPAPATSSGSAIPWKYRVAFVFIVALGFLRAPHQMAAIVLDGAHGIGVTWCTLVPSTCEDGRPHLELPEVAP